MFNQVWVKKSLGVLGLALSLGSCGSGDKNVAESLAEGFYTFTFIGDDCPMDGGDAQTQINTFSENQVSFEWGSYKDGIHFFSKTTFTTSTPVMELVTATADGVRNAIYLVRDEFHLGFNNVGNHSATQLDIEAHKVGKGFYVGTAVVTDGVNTCDYVVHVNGTIAN